MELIPSQPRKENTIREIIDFLKKVTNKTDLELGWLIGKTEFWVRDYRKVAKYCPDSMIDDENIRFLELVSIARLIERGYKVSLTNSIGNYFPRSVANEFRDNQRDSETIS